jgi:hypothetical protein
MLKTKLDVHDRCVEEKIVGELLKSAEKMACSGALVDIRYDKAA